MTADSKKVQTIINIACLGIKNCRAEVQAVKDKLAIYDAQSPTVDNTGTPFENGGDVYYRTKLAELEALLADPAFDSLMALEVPTHNNKALD